MGNFFRSSVFFVALAVLIGATFQAIAEVFSAKGTEVVYLPAAVVAAILMWHARVPARLPANAAWYAVLLLPALAFLAGGQASVAIPVVARPLLLIAVVLLLLRLTPHAGSVYERMPVPGVLVFFAFTALLYQSIPMVEGLRTLGIRPAAIDRIPAPMVNVAACAIVVAIFIVASGIRHRFLQPNPSRAWLWAGVALWIAAAAVSHVRAYATYAYYALGAAQALLFIGAFYLLSNLLPRRAADEAE
jgi:hypothetical protein